MKQTTIQNKRWIKGRLAVLAAFIMVFCATNFITNKANAQVKNIILVHGAFADGSGWQPLYDILTAKGYKVSVAGNPDFGVDEDVAVVQRLIDRQDGPCILVGHSWGGAVITVAGNSPKVVGLVYVAAFAPAPGETLAGLYASAPADPVNGILPPDKAGFVWYDRDKFHSGFCADLPDALANFMADSQLPIAAKAFVYKFTEVGWKKKPTWYIVAGDDHSIPPALERKMGKRTGGTVSEIPGASHCVFISHPDLVAQVVEAAADSSK